MDVTDEQLVARCKDELPYATGAFELLLRRYEPVVFRTCRRYLNHHQEAEEACQDAFLRAFHGLPKFAGRANFRTWLFRIVTNVCATRYAALAKARDRAAAIQQHAHSLPTVEAPARDSDQLEGPIGDALDTLAETDRQILLLRHVADLTLEEISEAIEMKLSATKMRLYRAEDRLREAFQQLQPIPEKKS